jgi:hypothetical protein
VAKRALSQRQDQIHYQNGVNEFAFNFVTYFEAIMHHIHAKIGPEQALVGIVAVERLPVERLSGDQHPSRTGYRHDPPPR